MYLSPTHYKHLLACYYSQAEIFNILWQHLISYIQLQIAIKKNNCMFNYLSDEQLTALTSDALCSFNSTPKEQSTVKLFSKSTLDWLLLTYLHVWAPQFVSQCLSVSQAATLLWSKFRIKMWPSWCQNNNVSWASLIILFFSGCERLSKKHKSIQRLELTWTAHANYCMDMTWISTWRNILLKCLWPLTAVHLLACLVYAFHFKVKTKTVNATFIAAFTVLKTLPFDWTYMMSNTFTI